MQKSKQKIKHIKPLIKVRTMEMENEAADLQKIRQYKDQVNSELKESQRKYLDNLQELNRLRSSSDRQGLLALESGLDYLRKQWTDLFKKVQELDKKEQAQIHQLNVAITELKSVEKLSDKYKLEFNKKRAQKEQLQEDESTIHRLLRSSIG